MNRRQGIALWLAGVLLAATSATSAYNGNREGEWLFEIFVPIAMVATSTKPTSCGLPTADCPRFSAREKPREGQRSPDAWRPHDEYRAIG